MMPGAERATINQRSDMKGFAETVLGVQEEMIEKDKTIKLLASPDTLLIR